MDKRYLTPLELLSIATQHAYSSDTLLQLATKGLMQGEESLDCLAPIISLMYHAFQLTFKAYCLHDHRPIKGHKNLIELIELIPLLGLSNKDIQLLKLLSKQYVFNKGLSYDLWDNRQQLHVFCEEIMSLYEKIQTIMPIELQSDYQ
jgi:hypothetical protein